MNKRLNKCVFIALSSMFAIACYVTMVTDNKKRLVSKQASIVLLLKILQNSANAMIARSHFWVFLTNREESQDKAFFESNY